MLQRIPKTKPTHSGNYVTGIAYVDESGNTVCTTWDYSFPLSNKTIAKKYARLAIQERD